VIGDQFMPAAAGQPSATRHVWLCADDYGISPSVNTAIRDLIVRGRLNATSVMVVAPSFGRSEATALRTLNAVAPCVAIGLHLTLTAPYRPLTESFAPTRGGAFLPLATVFGRAIMRRLEPPALRVEIAGQVRAFLDRFGRPPDFVDGHQHVHLFPQVAGAVLEVVKREAPEAWVRQCGSAVPLRQQFADRKGLLLDILSIRLRKRAAALGMRTNPAFAGTYDFDQRADVAALFARFLDRLPDGGLVMCHPGFVDAELERLDGLTTLREAEYAFLAGATFPALLASRGVALAHAAGTGRPFAAR
jgi:chitin disaccharide deacetylase